MKLLRHRGLPAFPMVVACAATALGAMFSPNSARADEGMWLYTDVPKEVLRQKHGFEPTDAWLEHLQKSSVRFMSGGSGSFVSEDGLAVSNHHVGSDSIQKLSTRERDLLRDGYFAKTLAEELPCPDLELNVLLSIQDVTTRVNAAVPTGATAEQANAARRAVQAEIEKEAADRTGLRCDVVTLYQGGAYHLYQYKRYTDVRLVFAPEQQVAFFGGDPDNFEYPRYNLDVAFFRAYEDGKPAKTPNHLTWTRQGVKEGELVFVSGHPGRTSRLLTVAELEYLRDNQFPALMKRLAAEEVLLGSWSDRSAENARRAKDELFTIQNSRKARLGGLAGLQDPRFFARLVEHERQFREKLGSSSEWEKARAAFDKIAEVQGNLATVATQVRMLETGWGFRGDLYGIARTLLRAAEERPKANGDRLREFRESNRTSLELDLFSDKPIYPDLETVQLGGSLSFLTAELGAENPLVKSVLDGLSPRDRAAAAIQGTKLAEVAVRKRLYEGGAAALAAFDDPLIRLARAVDAEARRVRKIAEELDETRRQAHAEIARARFALNGSNTYPDATGTLRLSFGIVKGFQDGDTTIPALTEMGGLYERAEAFKYQPPFDLPERWLRRKNRIDLDTPFNFISTADIIGGNSGSPTVNKEGELVGLIFDGNLASLVLDFAYDDGQARALSVDARSVTEALRSVYGAKRLLSELESGKAGR